MAREAGAATCLEKSAKRGVQGAINAPSEKLFVRRWSPDPRRSADQRSPGHTPGRESMRVLPIGPGTTGSGLSYRSHHAQRSGWRDLAGYSHTCSRLIAAGRKLTFPTKVPSDSLGGIGSLKRTSDKSLFPMALGSCGHRITHQLRPINMNGRSVLSETSKLGSFRLLDSAWVCPKPRSAND